MMVGDPTIIIIGQYILFYYYYYTNTHTLMCFVASSLM